MKRTIKYKVIPSIADIYLIDTPCHDFWMSFFKTQKRIYLDHAAATPLHPHVLEKMLPFLTEDYGNPSAIHTEGQVARQAIAEARQTVATLLGVKSQSILFTGSGTESNNLAILGHLEYLYQTGRSYSDMEIITTRIEHPSLLALVPVLEARGVKVNFLPVDECGVVILAALPELLNKKTALIALAYANSEVGTIQPIKRLVRQVRQYERQEGITITVHVDAAQAPLWLPCGLEQLGVDFLALDAGKCRGPKGVGILAAKRPKQLAPILFGGGQERGKRPGTENVAGIVGASEALKRAGEGYQVRAASVSKVRDEGLAWLTLRLPEAIVNGARGVDRLPNNLNISLPGFDTEYAVVFLDAHGVAASTKSACAGTGSGMSHVVVEMSHDVGRAKSTLRLTLGEETTKADIKHTLDLLVEYCAKMKTLTQ